MRKTAYQLVPASAYDPTLNGIQSESRFEARIAGRMGQVVRRQRWSKSIKALAGARTSVGCPSKGGTSNGGMRPAIAGQVPNHCRDHHLPRLQGTSVSRLPFRRLSGRWRCPPKALSPSGHDNCSHPDSSPGTFDGSFPRNRTPMPC